ncbi:calcium-binding protein [Gimibacter soli]|uniref:Calcium-binding protein n=1 Tax=Gimibacter soli TaxID=3024400 RepID=A0AAE9XMX0_9PROT|nr:calcium-binding protein [Gimibacter soli]WCL53948.1 calcium-binding protein [Gimibacter soli]
MPDAPLSGPLSAHSSEPSPPVKALLTIVGTTLPEVLVGGPDGDIIEGFGGDDTLRGGDGNDTLRGGDGDDLTLGGKGNDLVYLGKGNDVAWAGNGDTGRDTLYGESGNDVLAGGAGDDMLYGGTGGDTLYGGAGDDKIYGKLPGKPDRDQANAIWAGNGNDYIEAGSAGDVIGGGQGNDTLIGNVGADTLYGGAGANGGNDLIEAGGGDDRVFASNGTDTVLGGDGNDTLYGGDMDDVLDGGDGADFLYGGTGDDVIAGGDGDDTIQSGPGNDTVTGGLGADTFIFVANGGDDTIADFDIAADTLALAESGADFTSIDDLISASSNTTQGGKAGTLIDLGGGNSLFIEAVTVADLDDIAVTFEPPPEPEPEPDADIPGDTSSTVTLAVGGSLTSYLDSAVDQDWINISFEAARFYTLTFQNLSFLPQTLDYPDYIGIHPGLIDTTGGLRGISGPTNDSFHYVTMATKLSGDFFLSIRATGGKMGEYRVTLSAGESATVDLYSASRSGAGQMHWDSYGESYFAAGIQSPGDVDWLAISLSADTSYTFSMSPETFFGYTIDPKIVGVYNSAGTAVDGAEILDSANLAQVTFYAPESGTYYVAVGADGGTTGHYSTSTVEAVGVEAASDSNPTPAAMAKRDDPVNAPQDMGVNLSGNCMEIEAHQAFDFGAPDPHTNYW